MFRNRVSSPLPALTIFVIYFLLFGSSFINSSKLNEVVILSIDQVFDGSNNVITTTTLIGNANATGGNGTQNPNPWQNEGFIGANATQITSSFGSTIGISTKLLLATKASSLSTQMKDFAHTILLIKFSSIIGHTEPVEILMPTTPPPEDTTLSPEDGEEFHSSTLVYPPVSSPNLDGTGNVVAKVGEESKPKLHEGETPSHPQIQKTAPVVIGPSEVPVAPAPQTQAQPSQPAGPAILKLNAEGSDGHQVIEIALDPAALSNISEPVLPVLKISKLSDEVSANKGGMINAEVPAPPPEISLNMKTNRRKRDLNSEEISQIHTILTLTKNMKNIKEREQSKETKFKPKLKTIQEEIISAQDSEGAEDLALAKEEEIKGAEDESLQNNKPNTGKKLSYQTWRASMDKSFRPPGFYVTVDEKVLFDNFEGVWQSSTTPTVMGRTSPKKNGIWNDTVLMLQFDENPDRNIKISFEWEPTDPTAYLFLSNISISTYGANVSEDNVGPQYAAGDSNILGANNRNLTLYIVLKTPSTEQVIKMGDKPEVVEQGVVQIEPNVNKNPTVTTTPPKPIQPLQSYPKPTSTSHTSGGNTGLIVACITGCIALVILIFLLHKKLKINNSPNHLNHPVFINDL